MKKLFLMALLFTSCGGSVTLVSLDDGANADEIIQTGGDIMFLYGTDLLILALLHFSYNFTLISTQAFRREQLNY